jgi:hypothetical protein
MNQLKASSVILKKGNNFILIKRISYLSKKDYSRELILKGVHEIASQKG